MIAAGGWQDPEEVLKSLLEKRLKKAFAARAPQQRMSPEELQAGLGWLSSRFVVIHGDRSRSYTLEDCLNLARIAAARSEP